MLRLEDYLAKFDSNDFLKGQDGLKAKFKPEWRKSIYKFIVSNKFGIADTMILNIVKMELGESNSEDINIVFAETKKAVYDLIGINNKENVVKTEELTQDQKTMMSMGFKLKPESYKYLEEARAKNPILTNADVEKAINMSNYAAHELTIGVVTKRLNEGR